ncbi:MAG: AsmA-like C-terminal region-containing protein [Bacteroidales bacterium]|jgi:hypothetical protein|nr:AsmA-like C-terminal region-containing protein [Bacteroidales bacterium]
MRAFARIARISALAAISLLLILFALSLAMQNRVASVILDTLNRNFLTRIETGSYRFSLVRKFPRATIELRNVVVHSSPDFDHAGFGKINTDTLLHAKSAFIDFKMIDILKGDYTFKTITVRSGRLNLFTDSSGKNNYQVTAPVVRKDGEASSSLNLDRINLADIFVTYHDLDAELLIKGSFGKSSIKSRISGSNIDFDSNSEVTLTHFQTGGFVYKQAVQTTLEVGLNKNSKGVFFKKSTLQAGNWKFVMNGFVAADNFIDLTVSGSDIDIAGIIDYLPGKYRNLAAAYQPSGMLNIEGSIKGVASGPKNPHLEITWSVSDANIAHGRSRLKIDRFSFDGSLTNGKSNSAETAVLSITNFTTSLGSADYKGSLSITNFNMPKAELAFSGMLYPSELKDFLDLKNVESAGGSINLDISLSGSPGIKRKYTLGDFLGVDSRSEITFDGFRMKLGNRPVDITDATGVINHTVVTTASDFSMTVNGQRFIIDAALSNLPGWLSGLPVTLTGHAAITASGLYPERFSYNQSRRALVKTEKTTFRLPEDVNTDIDFRFDTLEYKSFRAEKISGKLSLQPGKMTISNIDLFSQGGKLTGDAQILNNIDRSLTSLGNFSFSGIDVNKTFTTFNNFGQSFIKAENLSGSLSGTLSLLLPADSLLNVNMGSVTAEGSYVLTNGALIDFDPVKELSSFIELSELENIKFDRLENDFFIRTNSLYIPQMDVRSSAVDLSVNGQHNFDNAFEYHVGVRLSEILSRKARNNKKLVSEFGDIEDDGLGRTSVLLKITGDGKDIKVSYDMKAAGNRIREEIKKERQTLKQIFSEEYGTGNGRAGDAGAETDEAAKATQPRFRITWEGNDTTAEEPEPEPAEEDRENLFENLFRKNR